MNAKSKLIARMIVLLTISASVAVAAYEIASVQIRPSQPVPFGQSAKIEVTTITPYSMSSLYRPTEVVTNGNHFSVFLYQESSGFTIFGSRTDVVELGVLPLGSYSVQVQLRPASSGGFTKTNFTGSFSVAPELEAVIHGESAEFRWSILASNYVLQVASMLSDQTGWVNVTNIPAIVNNRFVVTTTVADRDQFFRLTKQP